MAVCLIGLGSNLGDRRRMLQQALAQLAGHAAVRLCGQSPWLETPSAGGPPRQPPYLNGAVVVETSLPPEAMLEFSARDRGRPGPPAAGAPGTAADRFSICCCAIGKCGRRRRWSCRIHA